MIVIDGSQGEGGGQIFRSSLTLAMCLGKPVRIQKIRAGRPRPGLLRQHLTCVRAAQTISGAQVAGDELGSTEVTFKPGKVEAGEYRFSVGSAGSTSLVFQTILMPLFFSEGESEVTFEGGTHNGFSPSYDYIDQCFLPAIHGLGYRAKVELDRFGFYPAGGGSWKASIMAVDSIRPIELVERGQVIDTRAVATSSRIPEHINERELAQVKKKFFWPDESLQPRMVESEGPGNIVSLQIASENVTEVIEVVGEKKLSAERVAGRAIKSAKEYLEEGVPVGEHLADQLLLPMALGNGGRFRTLRPSLHFLTNVDVIKHFLDVEIDVNQENNNVYTVSIVK